MGSSNSGPLLVALVPVITMDEGGALPAIVSTLLIVPMVPGEGETPTAIVLEPWGTIGPMVAAENVKAGLELVIPVRKSGAVPLFDTVMVCIVAGRPGYTVPKSIEVGETVIAGRRGGDVPLTVNAALSEVFCPSGFATVTSRGPVAATIAMLRLAIIWVAVTVLESTLTPPSPPKERVAPG